MTSALRYKLAAPRRRTSDYGARQQAILDPAAAANAKADLASWPVYRSTPLLSLPGFAGHLGLGEVRVKHEGLRQPLGSFKALGGAFALGEALRDRAEASSGTRPGYAELFAGRHRATADGLHVVAATDGNHGRSLAWGARLFGVRCSIVLPWNVSAEREALIAEFGARIVRVRGNYDAAVAEANRLAHEEGCTLIQDTSFPGYEEPCRRIMYGYMLMAQEICRQWDAQPPTHVFLQLGCGGLAAAVAAEFWLAWGDARPRVVIVESLQAACFLDSLEAGERVVVEGDLDTAMIGIACGEVSLLAWEFLRDECSAALAIADEPTFEAMRLLARGMGGDEPLTLGETGAAGFGALVAAMRRNPELGAALGLDAESRVLLIGSETALDRRSYAQVVGCAPVAGTATS